jgi:hypothetical protein
MPAEFTRGNISNGGGNQAENITGKYSKVFAVNTGRRLLFIFQPHLLLVRSTQNRDL